MNRWSTATVNWHHRCEPYGFELRGNVNYDAEHDVLDDIKLLQTRLSKPNNNA